MLYLVIKWIHVLAAITAVGSNLTYGFWIVRATREPAVLPFTLRGIKVIDDRIANPAYGLLLITGFAMVWAGHLPLHMAWLELSLALYVVLVVLAAAGYTPTLKRQIAALDRFGVGSPEYQAAANRGRLLGALLGVIVVVIVFLMVVKPTLWKG